MADAQQSKANKQREELQIQIYIAEYEKLRDEVLQAINAQQQTLILALASVSIAIPILVGQTATIPNSVLATLLYILAIIYAVLVMNFVNTGYTVGVIGKYVHEYIEPKVNELLQTSSNHQVFY